MLTVADAFTGMAAMGPKGRTALSQVLACGPASIGRAPLGDLHDRRHRQRLRQALVGAAAEEGVLLRLADAGLGDLAPGANLLPDSEIGVHQCTPRLFALLARQRATRWSALLGLRVCDLRAWPAGGARITASILGLAFERSLVGLASALNETAPGGASVDLAILLDQEQAASDTSVRPLLDALAELSRAGRPEVVRQAATRLLRSTPDGAGLAVKLSEILEAAGDPRDVDVFVARTLEQSSRPTIDQLARRLRLSAERVRQIRARAEERVRAGAAASPQEVRALLQAVGSWLGSVVPADVADDVARRLGAGSSRTRIGSLLLWLAGPYLPVAGRDGWLALDPAEILAATSDWISQDGGVRPAQEVRDELAVEGVRAEHQDAWMAACGTVHVDDMVVNTAGRTAAVAERVLFAAGHDLTAAQMAALVPRAIGELRVVLHRDRRFVRVAADVFELAEWGGAAAAEAEAAEPLAATAPGCTSIDGRSWLQVPVAEALGGAGRPEARPVPMTAHAAQGAR